MKKEAENYQNNFPESSKAMRLNGRIWFGIHRGKSFEYLKEDRDYAKWLLKQEGFPNENQKELYEYIIKNVLPSEGKPNQIEISGILIEINSSISDESILEILNLLRRLKCNALFLNNQSIRNPDIERFKMLFKNQGIDALLENHLSINPEDIPDHQAFRVMRSRIDISPDEEAPF